MIPLVISSIVLIDIIDIIMIGITFSSLDRRFEWNLSPKISFVILLLVFAVYENHLVPIFYMLDATITVRNEQIARFFNLKPNMPLLTFFEIGFFDFLMWCIQAFFAGLIGEKILRKKEVENLANPDIG